MNLSTPEHLAIVDHLLSTTRSVRKRLNFDRPVPPELIQECLEIAIQAPSGSNRQPWHFLVITDPEKREAIGEHYRRSFEIYNGERTRSGSVDRLPEAAQSQMRRVIDSASYLAQNMGRAPALILPCIEGIAENATPSAQAGLWGSILPAAWSLMLALRARGLGTAWTTLHLRYADEVAALLDIPDGVVQAALLPVAWFTGDDFKPATRIPAAQRTYWDGWGKGEER